MSLLDPKEQAKAEASSDSLILPEGVYVCRLSSVEKWKEGTSLLWKYRVAVGPHAGHEFWDWTGLGEKAIWRTKTRFADLGFALDASEEKMLGTAVAIDVSIGVNNKSGDPKNVVDAVALYAGTLEEEPAVSVADEEKLVDTDVPF
jgi:hypothetical protein